MGDCVESLAEVKVDNIHSSPFVPKGMVRWSDSKQDAVWWESGGMRKEQEMAVRCVSKRTGNISLGDCGLWRAQGLASDLSL